MKFDANDESSKNQRWDRFADRHIGPQAEEEQAMLAVVGYPTVEALIDAAVPKDIRLKRSLDLPVAATELAATQELQTLASRNQVLKSFLGMGYYDCVVPGVIQRNVLENPGWYTQYTPYQAEIAQGRLEALLNFQTMVADLTGMEMANASLLDEATAAAEAMTLAFGLRRETTQKRFFVSKGCHPQTIAVVRLRAEPVGIEVVLGEESEISPDASWFGALLQYPRTEGAVRDYRSWIAEAKLKGTLVVLAADLLALTLLESPGALGADAVVGSAQRFGVPMGYGGPHAAYFATRTEYSRRLPGRIVGVSKDRDGRNAIRLTLQTREQHIRRDKATSNICTAQVLLAVMAGFYAVYHGPEGLKRIARRVSHHTDQLAEGLKQLGYDTGTEGRFDTIYVRTAERDALIAKAAEQGMNFRALEKGIGLSLDETTTEADLERVLGVFAKGSKPPELAAAPAPGLPASLQRTSAFLTHPTFHAYRSETEMLRYIRRLESRDLSLAHSMIPLGSCTMKLNASSEMFPVTWSRWGGLHPFAPVEQALGYRTLFSDLEKWIAEITGFEGVSLQPNSGAQGEYTGLLVIRAYHRDRGDEKRHVCLIPKSAHGTNPASAVMAGMHVVVVECDSQGNVDVADLRKKADRHKDELAALMVTYPSTHGVFESSIREICQIVHERGGQVYLDGANLNAQVGYCRPGDYGADVCHLNLHKTFCIPHGGGGPGMGPIAVKAHLAPFLPGHPVVRTGGTKAIGPVSAAPWGSASILTISWMYVRMMGGSGLKRATAMAILNANYMAKRLQEKLPLLYKGANGLVAHECIVDLRDLKKRADIEVEDVAKRLIDYGFHAPTVSWPVAGTIMIEPTESESKAEMDRFCDALLAISAEADKVARGEWPKDANPLKNAPHTADDLAREEWKYPYSRATAVFPAPWTKERKFWPSVSRIDNVYGDRNLFCSCPPLEEA